MTTIKLSFCIEPTEVPEALDACRLVVRELELPAYDISVTQEEELPVPFYALDRAHCGDRVSVLGRDYIVTSETLDGALTLKLT